ncbi:MAG: FAD synthase [Nitrosopumilales archaeon]|nr:FAD synthase [Nitrosopumilales archaeon]
MYVASLSDGNVIEIVKKKHLMSDDIINAKINDLVKNGLAKQDRKSLTELGRTSLKVVLAGGVFDIIHPGHIHTLNSAKALGDVLIVVVATDKTAQKMKKRIPLHNQKLRRELVDSLLMVDLCVVGNEEDIFKTVDLVRPEVIALGYDQVHQEKFIIDGCRKINLDVKVARLQSPIPEFSSSKIEKEYGESIHGI